MNGLLALRLALRSKLANPAPQMPVAPPIDLSPVVEELNEIKLALGVMQRMPRPVAGP